jgi:polyisoprenoid-binding protein YceI
MRTHIAATALLAAMTFGAQNVAAYADSTLQRAIDVRASKASFSVQHVFVERVGGTVPILSGSVVLPAGSQIPLEASASLDATKIDTGDPDRDGSLESPDFFDARRFPIWTFTSTKVTPAGPDTFAMDGLLTVHGVTQPEQLSVTIVHDAARVRYHAVAHVDRHAFGMAITRLDPAIGGTVDVVLDLVLR